MRYRRIVAALFVTTTAAGCGTSQPAPAGTAAAPPGAFESDVAFLRQNTDIIVLAEPGSASQVVVAPEYQGRVMTSTAGGSGAASFGWIGRSAIAARVRQPHINVFGGEDRFWLGPEGGQYSLYFTKGDPFDLDHWQVPEAFDWGRWEAAEQTPTSVRFRNPQGWLFSKEKAGGGMLSWLGCHYIDLLRYMTQDEIVSVQAEVATRSGENIDVEDIAVLSLRLKSGAVASIHAGYVLSLSGGGYHNAAGYDTYVGINGNLGRIHWGAPGAPSEMKVETAHPDWAGAPQWNSQFVHGTSPAYGGKSGEAFIRRFIESAQFGTTPWTTGEDALIVARVVDAAYESSRTGQRIDIEVPVTA